MCELEKKRELWAIEGRTKKHRNWEPDGQDAYLKKEKALNRLNELKQVLTVKWGIEFRLVRYVPEEKK